MTAQLHYLVPLTSKVIPITGTKQGPAWLMPNPRIAKQLNTLKELVAQSFGVPVSDLHLRRGPAKSAWARNVAMWLAHELELGPTTWIAAQFHKKNHSTICYAVQKVNDLRDCYPELRTALDQLRSEVEGAISNYAPTTPIEWSQQKEGKP